MNLFGGGNESSAAAQSPAPAGPSAAAGAPEADGAAVPEASAGSKVGNMKSGDYLIHVHVQYMKNVTLEGEDTCDPMVKINCFGQSKSSDAKNDITRDARVKLDQHIFVDAKKLTK
jgi:hypothetical protein